MNRKRTLGSSLVVATAAWAVLLAVPALVSASPTSSALTVGGTQQWAYGAEKWVNASVTLPNATFSEHAFFGWQVVFTATNTSATVQSWEAQRTMAGSFFADYCQPDCTAPVAHGNLSVTGWETDTGFANLTTAAAVDLNGTSVPAVGILNASFVNAGNLSESLSYVLSSGPITGGAAAHFTLAGSAHGAVGFTPALGLVPENLSGGTRWNSSAGYTSSGSWSVAYAFGRTTFAGVTSGANATTGGTLGSSGTLGLVGADVGSVTLANGLTEPVIVLGWTGPFDCVDGVIFVPHAFDLFASGHDWNNDDLGEESVATANLDVSVDAGHGLRVVAAATAFGSTPSSLPDGAAVSTSASVTALATTASSPSVVQGQPESVPAAQAGSACLLGACGGSSTSGGIPGAFVGVLVAVGIGVVLVGLLVGLRSRGRPPTPRAAGPPPPPGALP